MVVWDAMSACRSWARLSIVSPVDVGDSTLCGRSGQIQPTVGFRGLRLLPVITRCGSLVELGVVARRVIWSLWTCARSVSIPPTAATVAIAILGRACRAAIGGFRRWSIGMRRRGLWTRCRWFFRCGWWGNSIGRGVRRWDLGHVDSLRRWDLRFDRSSGTMQGATSQAFWANHQHQKGWWVGGHKQNAAKFWDDSRPGNPEDAPLLQASCHGGGGP